MKTVLQAPHLNQLIPNVLISRTQVRSVRTGVSLGLPDTLLSLETGVAPHVGTTVSAGNVEESDTLELGSISQLERLSITLNITWSTVSWG